MALASNALEVYTIPPPAKSKDPTPEAVRLYSVDLPGHRTDVRTLCLSSDDQLLASASNGKFFRTVLGWYFLTSFPNFRVLETLEHENYDVYPYYRLRLRDM